MCLSPHEMSNDQIREIVAFYTEKHEEAVKEGDVRDIRWFAAKVNDFKGILQEWGVPLIPEPEPVSVEQLQEIVGELSVERELVSA